MREVRRRELDVVHDNVSQIIGRAGNELGLALVAREELEKVLQLARVLLLEETLSSSGLAWMPAEARSSAGMLGLLAVEEGLPSFVDQGLVKETVNNTRVHPFTLRHARLEVTSNMLYVTFAGWVQGRAEAAGPVLSLSKELDDFFGVWAGCATMTLLVMLIKGVGPPETSVAAGLRARVLPPSLVELVLVALPVVLALEARLAGGAPVDILLINVAAGADRSSVHDGCTGGRGHLRRHGQRRLHARAVGAGRSPRHGRMVRHVREDGGMAAGAGAGRRHRDARTVNKRRGSSSWVGEHGWILVSLLRVFGVEGARSRRSGAAAEALVDSSD